jgi:protein PhnA
MSFEKELIARSGNVCELSGNTDNLVAHLVAPAAGTNADEYIFIQQGLKDQLDGTAETVANDWRCLNDSMWSEVPAVKVIAYRMLNNLKAEGWPADLIETMYLEDETLAWAKAGMEDEDAIKHIDSNGVTINAGDTVVLIKDLDVKGSSMVAKRGTSVRNVRLVHDNPELIEGKVNGQTIYILTQFVKK